MEENTQQQHIPQPPQEDEIDLVEIIRFLWDSRKAILIVAGIVVGIGLFIALFSTPQYKVEARILPEIQEQRTSTSALLRQFGGAAGFNFGSEGSQALRPDLYPNVLSATPFFYELLDKEIEVSDLNSPITVKEYVEEHMAGNPVLGFARRYTIGLPRTVLGWFRGKPSGEETVEALTRHPDIPRLSRSEHNAIRALRGRISADMDQQSWIISVSAELPDPEATAHLADHAVKYLSNYIIDYRTDKAQTDLAFVEERYQEKKQEFYEAQERLARHRDANRNIVSALVETEEQRLLDEYNLAYGVYNQLAQKLEETRMRVQEETPVIKLLEPVQVPLERSHPKRMRMMIVFTFLGGVAGVGVVFGRREFWKLKERLKE